ncbi:MAG: NTP transferase domain-containing protein [Planctomycetota bacterium]|nr:NTP transferase domain-containing protein [Planctomycetota bacterium]
MAEALHACVLAAGKGKRMGGQKPKVLFEAAGKTLLEWCLSALSAAGIHDLVVVVGFKKDEVVARLPTGVRWVEQVPQLGTGHAVLCARSAFPDDGAPLLVTCGDMPLLRPATFREVARQQQMMDAACVVLTTKIEPESCFGRVVRDKAGRIARIVEYQDATPEERAIAEGNTGVMCFRPQALWPTLEALSNDNAAGEYYLTDAIAALLRRGERVCAHCVAEPEEAMGVNTPEDLRQVEAVLRRREGV